MSFPKSDIEIFIILDNKPIINANCHCNCKINKGAQFKDYEAKYNKMNKSGIESRDFKLDNVTICISSD